MVNATLQVKPLHPTFAAEIAGVDFSQPITPELYKEIRAVVDKVSCHCHRDGGQMLTLQYGVVVLRNTGLTDDAHIDFSRYFGDLDDVTPYQQAGRTHRLPSKYLFDAGNIDP